MTATARGSPPGTVADRLRSTRRSRFVGRAAEKELFRAALEAEDPGFAVLFVHGPGGVGKTALLEELAELAETRGKPTVRLDGRTLELSPAGFLGALGAALGVPADLPALSHAGPMVLLLDTYELVSPLDTWLRESLVPALPAGTLVVVSGRRPPSHRWTTEPGWDGLVRDVALRNLAPDDARTCLRRIGVDPRWHDHLVALTHGHPLALSVVADMARQHGPSGRVLGSLDEAPDVVRVLLERFVEGVPDERHLEALQTCAHTRFTTQDLLRGVLGGQDAAELFSWLRNLSFVEEGPLGISPHDVARDALDADLRWRDRDRYTEMHHRVRRHLVAQVRSTRGPQQQRWVTDIIHLHRATSAISGFWDWVTLGSAYLEMLRPGDVAGLLSTLERHQGAEQAHLAEGWIGRPGAGFVAIRSGEGPPVGYAGMVMLTAATEQDIDADPGTRAMWGHALRHGPPRGGEQVAAARFFVDAEGDQQCPSTAHNVISARHIQHILTTESLSWDFIGPFHDGDLWEPLFTHLGYHRAHEAAYVVGPHRYAVFAQDYRRLTPERWFELMAERELGAPARPPDVPQELVLSAPEFAEAVRTALRDLHRTTRLAASPLLHSRVVLDAGDASPAVLRTLLEQAAESLREDPRDAPLYRALHRTYLRPAQTQELAAEALGLAFSTYRRHLGRGVERVVEWLWAREVHGVSSI